MQVPVGIHKLTSMGYYPDNSGGIIIVGRVFSPLLLIELYQAHGFLETEGRKLTKRHVTL